MNLTPLNIPQQKYKNLIFEKGDKFVWPQMDPLFEKGDKLYLPVVQKKKTCKQKKTLDHIKDYLRIF